MDDKGLALETVVEDGLLGKQATTMMPMRAVAIKKSMNSTTLSLKKLLPK
jgi:hypothetical protein